MTTLLAPDPQKTVLDRVKEFFEILMEIDDKMSLIERIVLRLLLLALATDGFIHLVRC